ASRSSIALAMGSGSLIVHQILWYKERLLIDVSLGGILMVVLIKSIILNLSKLRDAHLHNPRVSD
ncbi:hypothetical protein, partial [Klebsiella aerogenes]|uniref:hypothetical protein n=1 Tax=Klebsiella aerogenes TaxID=548 RepID=UPI001952BAFB